MASRRDGKSAKSLELVGSTLTLLHSTEVFQDLLIPFSMLGCSATSAWMELPAAHGGEGYVCRSDVNGDRRVDGIDLEPLLSQWGDGVSCDPQPTYPYFDLGNLNLTAG